MPTINVYPAQGHAYWSINPHRYSDGFSEIDGYSCVLVADGVAIGALRRYPTLEQALKHVGIAEPIEGCTRYFLPEA